jgi:hypothetical protein
MTPAWPWVAEKSVSANTGSVLTWSVSATADASVPIAVDDGLRPNQMALATSEAQGDDDMIDTQATANGYAPPSSPTSDDIAAGTRQSAGSRMTTSRIIGALFLVGFLSYGIGSGMVTSIMGGSNLLSAVAASQSLVLLGAFMMFMNTGVDLAKAVLFFPILEKHSKRTALAYLATMAVEVVLLDIGVLALLLIVSLAKHAGEAGADTLGSILVQANAMAYQLGEMTLGVGAVFLCLLLLRTRLIPRWLAISGLIGYPCLVAGTVAEIFGVHIGLYLTMPGFFFELALPLWLIIKGFQPEAYRGLPVNTRSSLEA